MGAQVNIKAIARDSLDKVLEQSIHQWIGKGLLVFVPALIVWGWNGLDRAKNRMIMESVKPELTKVGARVDSVFVRIDTLEIRQERAKKQNLGFQAMIVNSDPKYKASLHRMNSESNAAKAERKKTEDALEGLAE